jgi:hypothetical protein
VRAVVEAVREGGGKVRQITTEAGLAAAEDRVKATGLYLWCAHRWPEVYPDVDRAIAGRAGPGRAGPP